MTPCARCAYNGGMFALLLLFFPAVAFAQVDTSTTVGSTPAEVYDAAIGVYTSFQVSVLLGVEALLGLLVVLARFPDIKRALGLGPEDRLDWVPPLTVIAFVTFGAAAAAGSQGVMAAVGAGLAALVASPFLTSFIREISD